MARTTRYKSIEQAKAELEKAQQNLLESYFDKIRQSYVTYELPKQRSVLQGLETIIQDLEARHVC